MSWLLHNMIADMYGPYFLAFYGAVIVALVVACYRSISALDRSGELEPPKIPSKPDPYELAYLRGGENEVTRVAIASLIQRGLLKVVEKTRWLAKIKEVDRGRRPAAGEVSPVEGSVLKWPGFPAPASKIFQPDGIPQSIKATCAAYETDLAEKGLLAPAERKQLGATLFAACALLVLCLGGYKFTVALANGHRNVGFLFVFAILGVVAVAVACLAHGRTSSLGKDYLERVRLAYGELKSVVHPVGAETSALTLAKDPGQRARLQHPAAYADCLLMLGIFGITSLADTPLAELVTMFKIGSPSSGSCGGGCGSGSCGGGGGGCGGGGCGGCGG